MAGWGAKTNATSVMRILGRVKDKAQKGCSQATKDLAAKILFLAKENAPVQTGALRRSGRLEVIPGVGSSFVNILISFGGQGTGVDYATHTEIGTVYQPGQFFLLRAVRKMSPQLTKYNLNAFESAWDGEVRKSNLMKLV